MKRLWVYISNHFESQYISRLSGLLWSLPRDTRKLMRLLCMCFMLLVESFQHRVGPCRTQKHPKSVISFGTMGWRYFLWKSQTIQEIRKDIIYACLPDCWFQPTWEFQPDRQLLHLLKAFSDSPSGASAQIATGVPTGTVEVASFPMPCDSGDSQ